MRAILVLLGLGMTVFGAVILAAAAGGHQLTQQGAYAAGAVICLCGVISTAAAGSRGAAARPKKPVNPRNNGTRR